MNRVNLTGRLTKDIDLRKTQTNKSVVSFTLAVDSREKDNEGNYKAYFINCVAWNQSAEFLNKYAKKGDMLGVDGRLTTRDYVAQDGKKVYITEVVCEEVQKLSWAMQPKEEKVKEDNGMFGNTYADIKSEDLPFY